MTPSEQGRTLMCRLDVDALGAADGEVMDVTAPALSSSVGASPTASDAVGAQSAAPLPALGEDEEADWGPEYSSRMDRSISPEEPEDNAIGDGTGSGEFGDGYNGPVDDDGFEVEPNVSIGPFSSAESVRSTKLQSLAKAGLIRPFRSAHRGTEVPLSSADKAFIENVKTKSWPIMFVDENFKERPGTKTWDRCEKYRYSTTYSEAIENGMWTSDFPHAYARGHVYFPGRENPEEGHFVDPDAIQEQGGLEPVTPGGINPAVHAAKRLVACFSATFNDAISCYYDDESVPEFLDTTDSCFRFAMSQAHDTLVAGNDELCEREDPVSAKMFESPPPTTKTSVKEVCACCALARTDTTIHDVCEEDYAYEHSSTCPLMVASGFKDVTGIPDVPGATTAPTTLKSISEMEECMQDIWYQSMNKEMCSLTDTHTWEVMTREEARRDPEYTCPLRTMWVYRVKFDADGNAFKCKSRCVVLGNRAVSGVHFQDVYAPTASINTVRFLLAMACAKGWNTTQADVSNAFLQAPIDTTIFLEMPDGTDMKSKHPGCVLKLKKAMYGMPQAPMLWYECLKERLTDQGFKPLKADSGTFILEEGDSKCIMTVYVDDLLMVDNDASLTKRVLEKLGKRFPINENETGVASWLLGIKIERDMEAGTMKLSQQANVEGLLAKCGMTDCNPKRTPLADLLPAIDKPDPDVDPEHCVGECSYRQVIGSLLYLSVTTRPDISHAVNHLARFANCPSKLHVGAVKRVLMYLSGTKDKGLVYGAVEMANSERQELQFFEAGAFANDLGHGAMTAYADADYAAHHTRRSTSGWAMFLNGGPVSWGSKLQKVVATSTAEAEINAATEVVKEAVHYRLLLQEIGEDANQTAPTSVWEDNQAAMLMANNDKSAKGAKHFEIRLHYLQEQVQSGAVLFKPIPTDNQIADVFTKPLAFDKFNRFASRLVG